MQIYYDNADLADEFTKLGIFIAYMVSSTAEGNNNHNIICGIVLQRCWVSPEWWYHLRCWNPKCVWLATKSNKQARWNNISQN